MKKVLKSFVILLEKGYRAPLRVWRHAEGKRVSHYQLRDKHRNLTNEKALTYFRSIIQSCNLYLEEHCAIYGKVWCVHRFLCHPMLIKLTSKKPRNQRWPIEVDKLLISYSRDLVEPWSGDNMKVTLGRCNTHLCFAKFT